MSKCRYCNSSSYGSCIKSPSKVHEHIDTEKNVNTVAPQVTALVSVAHSKIIVMVTEQINVCGAALHLQVPAFVAPTKFMKSRPNNVQYRADYTSKEVGIGTWLL